jgi:Low molecular weight phosphotyrosine protein phosphatase
MLRSCCKLLQWTAFAITGNICRSPSAEAVFRAVVEREGLSDRFEIDSCGTGGGNPDWYFTEDPRRGWSYHEGDQAGVPLMWSNLASWSLAGRRQQCCWEASIARRRCWLSAV